MPKGEHFLQVSDADVRAILASSHSSREIARRYGINERTVRRIRAGHTRKAVWHECQG